VVCTEGTLGAQQRRALSYGRHPRALSVPALCPH
jgi:hypothetical protein